jgi:hypothetical protein
VQSLDDDAHVEEEVLWQHAKGVRGRAREGELHGGRVAAGGDKEEPAADELAPLRETSEDVFARQRRLRREQRPLGTLCLNVLPRHLALAMLDT